MNFAIFTRKPANKRLKELASVPVLRKIDSISVLDRKVVRKFSDIIRRYLTQSPTPHLDGPIGDNLVSKLHSLLVNNTKLPEGLCDERGDSDLRAVWIVEEPRTWLCYASIPRHTSIVMSFRLSTLDLTASKDFAFFLANRMRDMFCDGALNVSISSISMVVDTIDTFGFVTFDNVHKQWFDILCSSPLYDVAGGSSNSFFATWPLANKYLGAEKIVSETMAWARELAEI